MRTLYAVFRSQQSADSAVRDVLALPECQGRCEVVPHHERVDLHQLVDNQSLAVQETDGVPAVAQGIAVGAVAGVLLALLLRWLLAIWVVGPWLVVAFGALAGALAGGLGSGLIGVGMPDRQLRKLERDLDRGSVLVTFTVPDVEAEAAMENALRERGVRKVEHKHAV